MTQQSEEVYRANLESVINYIEKKYEDNRRIMGVKDVTEYTGKCYNTVKKAFFKKGSTSITAETFARKLANL